MTNEIGFLPYLSLYIYYQIKDFETLEFTVMKKELLAKKKKKTLCEIVF